MARSNRLSSAKATKCPAERHLMHILFYQTQLLPHRSPSVTVPPAPHPQPPRSASPSAPPPSAASSEYYISAPSNQSVPIIHQHRVRSSSLDSFHPKSPLVPPYPLPNQCLQYPSSSATHSFIRTSSSLPFLSLLPPPLHRLLPFPSRTPPNKELEQTHTYHTQQPPHRLAWLRPNSQPVFRPRRVQFYILDRLAAFVRRGGARGRVVGAEDFEGFGVAGCAGEGVGVLVRGRFCGRCGFGERGWGGGGRKEIGVTGLARRRCCRRGRCVCRSGRGGS